MKTDNIISAVICDIDGVLWFGKSPGKDSIKFIDSFLKLNIPFCLLTNSCNLSKKSRYKELISAGFRIKPDQLITASEVTIEWLQVNDLSTILYVGAPDTLQDFEGIITIRNNEPVDAVVVGDPFDYIDRELIYKATKAIYNGANFVAMQKNARWSDGKDWYADNGFWISGFEYVTGKQAVSLGKPNQYAYECAIRRIKEFTENCENILFISDDILSDLKGAKNAGLITAYFGPNNINQPWVDYYFTTYDEILSFLISNKHA